MEHEPKISLTEIFFITPLFLICDIIGIVLVCFGLDDFFLLDIIRFPLSQVYLYFKGLKGTVTLIGNILETIPYVGALPISTTAWLITVWIDHNPAVAEKVEKVAAAMPSSIAK